MRRLPSPARLQEVAKLLDFLGGAKVDSEGGDLEYILHVCDQNHDGAITKEELLPALATWKKLLESADFDAPPAPPPPPPPPKKSSACVLL